MENQLHYLSVDGVHCRFHELEDDELAKNLENYSHKFNGPGLAYELFCQSSKTS